MHPVVHRAALLAGPDEREPRLVEVLFDLAQLRPRRPLRPAAHIHVGEPHEQLHERHDASDFDLRTQDKLAPVDETEGAKDDAI